MSAEHSTQASATTARLQEAAGSGLPVLIPGARETRLGPPEVVDVIADPAAAYARAAAVFDRVRSEREPAKGPAGRHRTILARLWRRVWRGPEVAISDPHQHEAA